MEKQASFASELLRGQLTHNLSLRDAALCTELVMGSLRWQGKLDFIARRFTQGGWLKFDAEVRIALRLGIYQLLNLTRVPAHAAIGESVELVKRAGKTSAAGLVNAVLRKASALAHGSNFANLRPVGISDLEWKTIEWAYPDWLLARWAARLGIAQAALRAESSNQAPVVYVRGNQADSAEKILEDLIAANVNATPSAILKDCITILGGEVTATGLYHRGEIAIQDQASQLIPLLLDVRPGHRVLDLCAAPGNKTALLARYAGASGNSTQGRVIAGDLHHHRLRYSMVPAMASGGPNPAANIHRVVLDGTQPLPFGVVFDRILVDAPCSGTGTLRRNPEIKWRLQPEAIPQLAALQFNLLDRAAAALLPGGRIVYSTCSFEPEENRGVVEAFLASHSEFRLVRLREESPRLTPFMREASDPRVGNLLAADYLETSPEQNATDGFFAALLQRSGTEV